MEWAKTSARRDEKHLCLGIGRDLTVVTIANNLIYVDYNFLLLVGFLFL